MGRGSIKKVERKQKTGGRKKFEEKLSPSQIIVLKKRIHSALTHPMHQGKNKFEYIVQILGIYVVGKWKKPNLGCVGCPHISSKDLINFLESTRTISVKKEEEEEEEVTLLHDFSKELNDLRGGETIVCKKEEFDDNLYHHENNQNDDRNPNIKIPAQVTKSEHRTFEDEERAINEVNIVVKKEEELQEYERSMIEITKSLAFKPDPTSFRIKIILSTIKSLNMEDLLFQYENGERITSNVLSDCELKTIKTYMSSYGFSS